MSKWIVLCMLIFGLVGCKDREDESESTVLEESSAIDVDKHASFVCLTESGRTRVEAFKIDKTWNLRIIQDQTEELLKAEAELMIQESFPAGYIFSHPGSTGISGQILSIRQGMLQGGSFTDMGGVAHYKKQGQSMSPEVTCEFPTKIVVDVSKHDQFNCQTDSGRTKVSVTKVGTGYEISAIQDQSLVLYNKIKAELMIQESFPSTYIFSTPGSTSLQGQIMAIGQSMDSADNFSRVNGVVRYDKSGEAFSPRVTCSF